MRQDAAFKRRKIEQLEEEAEQRRDMPVDDSKIVEQMFGFLPEGEHPQMGEVEPGMTIDGEARSFVCCCCFFGLLFAGNTLCIMYFSDNLKSLFLSRRSLHPCTRSRGKSVRLQVHQVCSDLLPGGSHSLLHPSKH